jgi:ketosteroid isomerase-like protein
MGLRHLRRSIVIAALTTISACDTRGGSADSASATDSRARITETLERYQEAARRVDASAMAAFYAPSGVLFEPGIPPIVTRDSIRAFLASFPGVKVHTATATADTIDVFGRRAYLWGSYFEHLSFPGQPTSEQHGKFVMEWARQPTGEWLIVRLYRIPLPAQRPTSG